MAFPEPRLRALSPPIRGQRAVFNNETHFFTPLSHPPEDEAYLNPPERLPPPRDPAGRLLFSLPALGVAYPARIGASLSIKLFTYGARKRRGRGRGGCGWVEEGVARRGRSAGRAAPSSNAGGADATAAQWRADAFCNLESLRLSRISPVSVSRRRESESLAAPWLFRWRRRPPFSLLVESGERRRRRQTSKLPWASVERVNILGSAYSIAFMTYWRQVNPGSKAAQQGVREGDLISSINGRSTRDLTNSEAHALLRNAGEHLKLGLNQENIGSPKRRIYKSSLQENTSTEILNKTTTKTITTSRVVTTENKKNGASKFLFHFEPRPLPAFNTARIQLFPTIFWTTSAEL
ncbi:hypothetical protein KM043_014666 [Ampulex compressa]|nr:hypothetical protein KM043_014666 [Ampulex compressa]